MSKDSFKIKKGLTLKPQDPSTLTGLEDGDLIIDSTDGNKLKKYNSTKVGFEDVTTPGSAQALNLLTDASFETEDAQFDIAPVGQLFSFEEHGVGAGLYTPTNLQYLQVQNASANTLSISRDENHSADLQGKQGLLTIWLKTSSEGFKVGVRVDGVDPTQDSIDQLSVRADGTWRKYELPFVFGSTSIGYKVYSDTSQVNAIDIDNVYMGLSPDGYTQQVGQAQFVGKAFFADDDCNWERVSSTYGAFTTPTLNTCFANEVIGNITVPSPADNTFITIPNFRTDGYYRVQFQGLMFNDANAGQCIFNLSKDSTQSNNGEAYTTASEARGVSLISGDFRFNDGDSGNINLIGKNISGANECSVRGQVNLSASWSVYFFPDADSTITTQNTELTAATANELSAKVSSTGVVSDENYDWIDGDCSVSTGVYTCNLNSIGITTGMNCIATSNRASAASQMNINSSSSTQVIIGSYGTGGSVGSDQPFHLICSKQGSDVNKSATVVGKFANIEEIKAPLTAATANEFTAYVSSTGVVSDENLNWIDGNCTSVGGTFDCNLNPALSLSTKLNCQIDGVGTSDINGTYDLAASSTSAIRYRTYSTSGAVSDQNIIRCSKTGADYNLDQVGAIVKASDSAQEIADIVRTDIISSDLCQVEARGNSGGGVSADVTNIDFLEISDNCNAWNGSEFTAPNTSAYLINGATRYTAGVGANVFLWKDTGSGYVQEYIITDKDTSSAQTQFSKIVFLNQGDKIALRNNVGATLNNSNLLHFLEITELPDTNSIVENLNQNPRVSLQDQYSETEIEWGRWNGQQLYRRCFTVTTPPVNGQNLVNWGTGLKPKGIISDNLNQWVILNGNYDTNNVSRIRYDSSDGNVKVTLVNYTIQAGTSFCMNYTK